MKVTTYVMNVTTLINNSDFTDSVKELLFDYMNMLTECGKLIPTQSLNLQFKFLRSLGVAQQEKAIEETISHRWFHLKYAVEQIKNESGSASRAGKSIKAEMVSDDEFF